MYQPKYAAPTLKQQLAAFPADSPTTVSKEDGEAAGALCVAWQDARRMSDVRASLVQPGISAKNTSVQFSFILSNTVRFTSHANASQITAPRKVVS